MKTRATAILIVDGQTAHLEQYGGHTGYLIRAALDHVAAGATYCGTLWHTRTPSGYWLPLPGEAARLDRAIRAALAAEMVPA